MVDRRGSSTYGSRCTTEQYFIRVFPVSAAALQGIGWNSEERIRKMKFTREQIAKALKLYVITDRSWLKEDETLLSVCEKVIQNGATFLQLREKELGAEETRKEAIELQKLCHRYNIPFVVNDSVEIALEMDADGVHVGQSDIKERDIRAMIGPDKILGMTAKTVEQAIAAEKAGADYIGTGAVFGSTTKKDAKYLSMEELKKIAASVSIPVVAIGGINSENVSQLEGSGVNGAAVISGIFAAEDPAAKTAQMSRLTDIFC